MPYTISLPGIDRKKIFRWGLIRSSGGWVALKALRKNGQWQKGDERILGDSDFVEKVLKEAEEQLDRKAQQQTQGYDLNKIAERISTLLGCSLDDIWNKGKYQQRVKARSLLCYWANHYPGTSQTQPAVSMAVKHGEEIVKQKNYTLRDNL